MKRNLITVIIVLWSMLLSAQAPFYGARLFISADKQDTIYINSPIGTISNLDSIEVAGVWYSSFSGGGEGSPFDTTILSTSNFNLYNEADPTKKINFANTGQSTGTTSTITVNGNADLTKIPTYGTSGQMPYVNATNNGLNYSSSLSFNGTTFTTTNTTTGTVKLTSSGLSSGAIYFGDFDNYFGYSGANLNLALNGTSLMYFDGDASPRYVEILARLKVNELIERSGGYITSYSPLRYSGVTISDDNDLANKGYVDNKYIFTTKTFASPLNVDFSTAVNQRCVITGTTTVNVSNIPQGTSILILKQNATGYAITIGTGWGTLRGTGTLKTTANAINVIQFIYDGTDTLYSILP